jgi:hypothetical protein
MTLLERSAGVMRDFAARFAVRRDNGPIDTVAELQRFVASRSAFVAQHKLYGYLKTRMGTRYPSMFEDDVFIGSVNIAKMHVYAACVSDMTIYAVSKATDGSPLVDEQRNAMARQCREAAIEDNADHAPDGAEAKWRAAFDARLKEIHWANMAAGGDAFTASPKALLHWAPIADELKRYDGEIVRNSVTFAWPEHMRELRRRLVPEAVVADWRAQEKNLPTGPAGP